jgi:serine/threonine protein kinase
VVAVLSMDPVAIALVAVDARVPPAELTSELSEFRLEVKASLSNLDKKMQKMLDGKRGDRKEIADLKSSVDSGLQDLRSSVDSGLQRDASFKRRVAQTLEKRSKKDFVRQTKEAQLEQFEVEPDRVEDKPFAKGGEGEVFMGEYQGDAVVLKKMSLVGVTAIKRRKMLNSFKGELAIMVRLRSPRVAHFYGVVTTDPTFLGLVMEFCPGGSLRGALDTEEEITSDRRRVWVSDVALGMAYLYSQGVEHRDLKALNVLLTEKHRCKVTDFGLSKCEDLKTAGTATMGGVGLAGTPAFMAPELLEDNTFNEKSDVYSFAFVMFEIWSGDSPWKGLQVAQIVTKVLVRRRGRKPPTCRTRCGS